MAKHAEERDIAKEGMGWISLTLLIFLFPVLFFLCVWTPMWMGWASRW